MGNPQSFTKLPDWLNRLLATKPVQPRCTCGRFCSTHDEPASITSKLVDELEAQGKFVPPSLRRAASMPNSLPAGRGM